MKSKSAKAQAKGRQIKWKRPGKSFLRICIIVLALYAVFEMAVSYVCSLAVNRMYIRVMPSMDQLLRYETRLMNDQFDMIPEKSMPGCEFLVFDGEGNLLKTTDEEASAEISFEELDFIPDYDADYYYEVYPDAKTDEWWILKISYVDENGESQVKDYAIVDGEGNIVEGELFAENRKITSRELSLLQGYYSQKYNIQKYSYVNKKGESRTLVLAAPSWTEDNTRRVVGYVSVMDAMELAVKIFGLILAGVILARRFRSSMVPLNTALQQYTKLGSYNPEELVIPSEVIALEHSFRQLTEHVEASNQRLMEEEQEKSRMIMNLTHDLKSPLTVIQGYAKALENRMVPEDQIDRYLQVLCRKADTAVMMINDLMQYATMEHPDYQLHMEKTDICELCRTCLVERYEEIEDAGMETWVEIPDTPIERAVDARIFGGILDNLISNTIRYNKEGTLIFVSLEVKDHQLILKYADTGTGIPEQIREDLFKPFVIGNQARTSVKGTGIGMSIVKRAVDLHHGSIQLADPAGTRFSTIFEMYFPMEES